MGIRKRYVLLWVTGFLMISLLVAAKIYYRQEHIRVALLFGGLSDLPADAINVEVETVGNMFSRTFWLAFESSDTNITSWLKQAEELEQKEWHAPSGEYQAIQIDPVTGKEMTYREEINNSLKQEPEWFNPKELREVEYYEIQLSGTAYYGQIWIDRKSNRVWIKTSYS